MKSITIHEVWCAQQQQDFDTMMRAVDDLGAASLALSTHGAQAYTQFIEARDNFKTLFRDIASRYRYVE
jgi:peroxiredoxin